MNNSRHLVFGAGLIGCFLAGALCQNQKSVSIVARESTRKKYRKGLHLSDYLNNEVDIESPHFIETDGNTERFNIIWLTVKCTTVESTIADLQKLLAPDGMIVCCQNGLGSDKPLRKVFSDNAVLTAIVGYNVIENENHGLHRSTQGEFIVESNPNSDALIESLSSPLMPTKISADIEAARWAKLQLNLANPVNALADIPVKAMTEDAEYRKVIAVLMQELLEVCTANNLDLPQTTALPARWLPFSLRLPNFIYLKIAQKMLAIDPTARLSMWWDLQANKKTEIEFLNGAIVEHGLLLGIECPCNAKMVSLIHEVEAGEREIGLGASEMMNLLRAE